MMMKVKERIMYGMLLLASLWVLVLTAVPHHHHLDGSLCIAHCEAVPSMAHAHAHGCDIKSGNHPQMIVENEQIKSQGKTVMPVSVAGFLSYYFTATPDILVIPYYPTVYHELLHSVWSVITSGLRAPPVLVV